MRVKAEGKFYSARMAITLRSGAVNLYLSDEISNPDSQMVYYPILVRGDRDIISFAHWRDRYWRVEYVIGPNPASRVNIRVVARDNDSLLKRVAGSDPLNSRG